MKPSDIVHAHWYNPDNLFDTVVVRLKLKNSKALAKLIRVAPSMLSNMRARQVPVGVTMLVRLHEVTGLSISELRLLMGDQRKSFFDDFDQIDSDAG